MQKIGNSQGIVIPNPLLAQLGIERAVEIQIVDDHLEVRKSAMHPREGWAETLSALPQSARLER
ncbi:MAG: AbrB/MazE/SpoVT family DNA-binding domain-containing protein [Candidatus Tumulicola sp.]